MLSPAPRMLAVLAKAAAAVQSAVVGSAKRAVQRMTGLMEVPPTAPPPPVAAQGDARIIARSLAAMSEQAHLAAGALNSRARNAAGAVGALSEQARNAAGAMGMQAKALAGSVGENGRCVAEQAAAQVREEARRRTRRLLAYGFSAVALAAFGYGLGSNLPMQVRLYLEGERGKDK